MTQHTLNWALALALVALVSAMQVLDGPDDIQTERTVAADLADAQTQAQTQALAQASEVQP
jgi:hypothetical protein